MWRWISKLLLPLGREQRIYTCRLQRIEDGFSVERDGITLQRLCWQDVNEITAYRYNGTRTDQITIVFHTSGDDGHTEAMEESNGWSEVVAGMLMAFPTISRDWRFEVEGPPTWPAVPQFTTLYKRS